MHPTVRKVFEDLQRRETFSPLPYVMLMRRRPLVGNGPLAGGAASGAEPPAPLPSAVRLHKAMRGH